MLLDDLIESMSSSVPHLVPEPIPGCSARPALLPHRLAGRSRLSGGVNHPARIFPVSVVIVRDGTWLAMAVAS